LVQRQAVSQFSHPLNMLEEARNRAWSCPFGFALQFIPAGCTGMDNEQRVDSGNERIVEPVRDGAVNLLMDSLRACVAIRNSAARGSSS